MELDDLKKTWDLINDRMKQKEKMDAAIIKEMLLAKSDKAFSRIINYDFFSVIVSVSVIGLLTWQMTRLYFGPFKTGIFLFAIVFLIVSALRSIRNILILNKINFTNPVNENIRLVQHYNITVKRNRIVNYSAVVILIALVVVACLLSPNMEMWRWITIAISVVAGSIGAWWEYKQMYRKNIDSILQSLEELKDLEEN